MLFLTPENNLKKDLLCKKKKKVGGPQISIDYYTITRKDFLKAVIENYIFVYLLLTGGVMTLAIRKIISFLSESPKKNSFMGKMVLLS